MLSRCPLAAPGRSLEEHESSAKVHGAVAISAAWSDSSLAFMIARGRFPSESGIPSTWSGHSLGGEAGVPSLCGRCSDADHEEHRMETIAPRHRLAPAPPVRPAACGGSRGDASHPVFNFTPLHTSHFPLVISK